MATEVYLFIDGIRVDIPQTPQEAADRGWHLGTEFKSFVFLETPHGHTVVDWCKNTFDPHLYKVFMRSIWFYRESDSVICKLRWS